jgi:hypothetical protein
MDGAPDDPAGRIDHAVRTTAELRLGEEAAERDG